MPTCPLFHNSSGFLGANRGKPWVHKSLNLKWKNCGLPFLPHRLSPGSMADTCEQRTETQRLPGTPWGMASMVQGRGERAGTHSLCLPRRFSPLGVLGPSCHPLAGVGARTPALAASQPVFGGPCSLRDLPDALLRLGQCRGGRLWGVPGPTQLGRTNSELQPTLASGGTGLPGCQRQRTGSREGLLLVCPLSFSLS